MAGLILTRLTILLCLVLTLFTPPTSAQCNTDQNPSCAGNSAFEALCCAPGNICYWSNRNGDAACCQAGTDCQGDGGPAFVAPVVPNPVTQVQKTTYFAETVYSSTVPLQSTVTYYESKTSIWSPTPSFASLSTVVTPGVVVVTSTFPVVQTAPVETGGAYVTVTQVNVVAGAARYGGTRWSVLWAAVVASSVALAFVVFG
ncbi:hypothetical protein PMZ80_008514 [Knufia obscura]|uniref:Uncharacterized protein n=2 Tax=Knufia TaxID=430999 RepID=A0AAN8EE07_9EURO|nr:hypothetical protein PMZ80_008514 [Knufia obscura]KAK5951970.1 hypothetical protein OHC33_006856 [Knufia fluminis]